ncbi:MAG: metallophosphoesterase, partial [Calditrichaceae bacterium]|nr:metallophosphoesterase [Calditrichaceae bacterium]
MKFCVISDLHCKYQLNYSEHSESLLKSNMPRKPASQHPVVAMLNAIESDNSIKSEVLLCLGDLGDKADEQGITSAWAFAEEIRLKLGSAIKIGIPGNHDVNSRHLNGKDAFTYIQSFHELFPTNDTKLNAEFWGKGFCIQIYKENLFLLINTV